jgi:hypothetical protein
VKDQKKVEEIVEKTAAKMKGVSREQIKKVVELKFGDPNLGYRRIGRIAGLKKDKVMKVWKAVQSTVVQTSAKPEEYEDEGKFCSEAFSFIGKCERKSLKPREIAIELVKRFQIVPSRAREIVEQYFGLRDLDAVQELREEIDEDFTDVHRTMGSLEQKIVLALEIQGKRQRDGCTHFQKFNGLCTYWSWKDLPDNRLICRALAKYREGWCLRVSEYPEYCATCSVPLTQKLQSISLSPRYVSITSGFGKYRSKIWL